MRMIKVLGALVLAILIPNAVMLAIALTEPPPWRLVATPDATWRDGQALPGGGRARIQTFDDPSDARDAAEALRERTPTLSSVSGRHDYRYTTPQRTHGLIAAIDRFLLVAEAPDAQTLERGVDTLPFLVPQATLGRVLDRHWTAIIAAVLGYALLCSWLFCRGLSWAGRRAAAPGIAPASEAVLRERLATLNHASATGAEIRIASPDGGAMLRLRLDASATVVRVLSTHHAVQSGRTWLLAGWWRTIPSAGGWAEPAARIVTAAGWEWRPVVTFLRVVGG